MHSLARLMEYPLLEFKKQGFENHLTLGAGGIGAVALAHIMTKFMWRPLITPVPECQRLRDLLHGIWGSSGGTIEAAPDCQGVHPTLRRRLLYSLRSKDIIDNELLIVEHELGANIWQRIKALRKIWSDTGQLSGDIGNMFLHGSGLLSGAKIEQLMREQLPSNDFGDTKPPLFIISVLVGKHGTSTYVFSHETTPNVPISEAVIRSMALRFIIKPPLLNGERFIDGAHREPLALRSIVDRHIRLGKDPRKLFIIGAIIDDVVYHENANLLAEVDFYLSDHAKQQVIEDAQYVRDHGAKLLLVIPTLSDIHPPREERFENMLHQMMSGFFGFIKNALVTAANARRAEEFRDEFAKFITRRMNIERFPFYIEYLERNQIVSSLLREQIKQLSI